MENIMNNKSPLALNELKHPFVKSALKLLRKYQYNIKHYSKYEGQYALIDQSKYPPSKEHGRYSLPIHDGGLPITVGMDNFDSILKLVDAIFMGLEKNGFKFEINTEHGGYRHELHIKKDDEILTFYLREGYSWQLNDVKPNDYWGDRRTAYANGTFIFLIEDLNKLVSKQFKQSKQTKLEDQIEDIINAFIDMPQKIKNERQEREDREKKWQRHARIERHNEDIIRSQNAQLDIALNEAKRFRLLNDLNLYLSEIESKIKDLPINQKSLAVEWLNLVKDKANDEHPILNRIKNLQDMSESESDENYWRLQPINEDFD